MKIQIKNNNLVITISLDTLATAFELSDYNNSFDDKLNDFKQAFKVTNKVLFAKEVILALEDEEEDGTTLLHQLFDKATENAVENGALGIEEVK